MNKLLAILLLCSLALNFVLLSDTKLGETIRAKQNSVSTDKQRNTPIQFEDGQAAGHAKHQQIDSPISDKNLNTKLKQPFDLRSNFSAEEQKTFVDFLSSQFDQRNFEFLQLGLRDFLNQYPRNEDALMLEAKYIMHTQTLNYALTHYYELHASGLINSRQEEIEKIILQQTSMVIQQLTGDNAWEILATFLEPLLQVDPLNHRYIIALARAYGMQDQRGLMENVLAAMTIDNPRALRLREEVSKRLSDHIPASIAKEDAQRSVVASIDESSSLRENEPDAIAKISSRNQLFTPLTLVDQKATMLLDTGASTSAVKSSIIDAISRQNKDFVGYFNVQTAGGAIQAPLYRLKTVSLGKSVFRNTSVIALPDDSLGNFDGLLGMNILKSFEMNFDQGQQQMSLYRK